MEESVNIMDVFVYEVRARADIFGGGTRNAMKVIKHIAKDTGKSLMFNSKRLDKTKLENFSNQNQHDCTVAIGFHTFVMEEQLEQAKRDIVAHIQNHAQKRLTEILKLLKLQS